jgi:preprotein translocase subunit YajC
MHFLTILASGSDDSGGGAALLQLGIFLLIPVAMYFLLIRPQRRRMREQQALQSQLEVGDEVITTSGVYGFITGFEDDRIWLEIDDDVQIRIARAAVQGKVDTSATASAQPPSTGSREVETAGDDAAPAERDADKE